MMTTNLHFSAIEKTQSCDLQIADVKVIMDIKCESVD